jgi:hypothetical protein
MADPVLTLVLIVCFFAAAGAARWFKTLDGDFARAAATPAAVGIACGIVLCFIEHPIVIGVLLTIGAVYVRHIGHESEPVNGMLLGSLIGAAAALPPAIAGADAPRIYTQCVVAAAIAGFGITFAAFHVADRSRQLALDAVTAAVAVGSAYVPYPARRAAIAVTVAVPLIAVAAVFKQWRSVRAELSHEASLGFMDDGDVRTTAHPIRRFGRGGWVDAAAHRQFVRLSNRIALRKRQQRNRPDEIARLYQLEIIKLRMQVQRMTEIDRHARGHGRIDDGMRHEA